MAELYQEPIYGKAYKMKVALISIAADGKQFLDSPSVAAGNVLLHRDNALPSTLTNTPTVAGLDVEIELTAAEMAAQNILMVISDGGVTYADLAINIQTKPSRVITSGTASGAGNTASLLDSTLVGSTDLFKGSWINLLETGECRQVLAFNSGTGAITFGPPSLTATAQGDRYELLPAGAVDIGYMVKSVLDGNLAANLRAINTIGLTPGNTKTADNFDAFFQNSGSGTVKVVDDVGGGGGTGTTTIDVVAYADATSGQVAGELNDYVATQVRGSAEWWIQSSANAGVFQADLHLTIGATLGAAGWNPAVVELAIRTQPGSGGVGNLYFYDYTNTQWDSVSYGTFGESDVPINLSIIIPTSKRVDFVDPVTGNMQLRCEVTGIKNLNYLYWDFCETSYVDGDVEVLTAQEIAQVTDNLLTSNHGMGVWKGNTWVDGYIGGPAAGLDVTISAPITSLPANLVPACYLVSAADADGAITFEQVTAYDGDVTLTLKEAAQGSMAAGDRYALMYLAVDVENIGGDNLADAEPLNANVIEWLGVPITDPLFKDTDIVTNGPINTTTGVADANVSRWIGDPISDPLMQDIDIMSDGNPISTLNGKVLEVGTVDEVLSLASISTSFIGVLAPSVQSLPAAGTDDFKIIAYARDENGDPVNVVDDLGGNLGITWFAEDFAGNDMTGNIGTISNPITGRYEAPYTMSFDDNPTEIIFAASGVIGTDNKESAPSATIINASPTDVTVASMSQAALEQFVTDSLVNSPIGNSVADHSKAKSVSTVDDGAKEATLAAVKAKTDNLPADPAGVTDVNAARDVITTQGGPGPWTTGTASDALSHLDILAPSNVTIPDTTPITFTVRQTAFNEDQEPTNVDGGVGGLTWVAEDFQGNDLTLSWAGAATNPSIGVYERQFSVAVGQDPVEVIFSGSANITSPIAGSELRTSGPITTNIEDAPGSVNVASMSVPALKQFIQENTGLQEVDVHSQSVAYLSRAAGLTGEVTVGDITAAALRKFITETLGAQTLDPTSVAAISRAVEIATVTDGAKDADMQVTRAAAENIEGKLPSNNAKMAGEGVSAKNLDNLPTAIQNRTEMERAGGDLDTIENKTSNLPNDPAGVTDVDDAAQDVITHGGAGPWTSGSGGGVDGEQTLLFNLDETRE